MSDSREISNPTPEVPADGSAGPGQPASRRTLFKLAALGLPFFAPSGKAQSCCSGACGHLPDNMPIHVRTGLPGGMRKLPNGVRKRLSDRVPAVSNCLRTQLPDRVRRRPRVPGGLPKPLSTGVPDHVRIELSDSL